MRQPTSRELAHDRLAAQMAELVSNYDTGRRLDVLIEEFLVPHQLAGKLALDVGCGLGFFSERLVRHGATVTACDLGEQLVAATQRRAGCEAVVADALALERTFGRDRFDIVVSSECIEHTPDPAAALAQMFRVLKPGGLLSLSTPNLLWQPIVRAASRVRLRPFDGYENFTSWPAMRRAVRSAGGIVLAERGLHLFPFQLGAHAWSRLFDRRLQFLRGVMINICVLARKHA